MPRQIVRLVLAVLILASLFGGRSLVANLADGTQHVVKPGETLSGIAAQYGVTVDQLVALNGINDPDRLVEGLYRDIDTIASAYGWDEPTILALPADRRRRYVELIATRTRTRAPRRTQ